MGKWRVAGVDHSNGKADGVLVFGGEGEVALHTNSLERGPTPISIRVRNVQSATVNSPDPAIRAGWDRVIVEEEDRTVSIDGVSLGVRTLRSYSVFSFEVVVGNRIVSAAGELDALDTLRIVRCAGLSLSGL